MTEGCKELCREGQKSLKPWHGSVECEAVEARPHSVDGAAKRPWVSPHWLLTTEPTNCCYPPSGDVVAQPVVVEEASCCVVTLQTGGTHRCAVLVAVCGGEGYCALPGPVAAV